MKWQTSVWWRIPDNPNQLISLPHPFNLKLSFRSLQFPPYIFSFSIICCLWMYVIIYYMERNDRSLLQFLWYDNFVWRIDQYLYHSLLYYSLNLNLLWPMMHDSPDVCICMCVDRQTDSWFMLNIAGKRYIVTGCGTGLCHFIGLDVCFMFVPVMSSV